MFSSNKKIEKSYQVIISCVESDLPSNEKEESRFTKEGLVDERFRPMREWLTRARRARERKKRDIKEEEE